MTICSLCDDDISDDELPSLYRGEPVHAGCEDDLDDIWYRRMRADDVE